MTDVEKIACRTPAEGRDGVTRIPKWKFDLIRGHILALVEGAGEAGFPFSDLTSSVGARLREGERNTLGSVGWHTTTVKLEMEVAGDLQRLPGSPQKLVLEPPKDT